MKFDKFEHIGLCMILTSLASTLRAFVVSGALVTTVLCLISMAVYTFLFYSYQMHPSWQDVCLKYDGILSHNCLQSAILSCFIPIHLPSFVLQFPSELDPWKILQEHVLSDYLNHEVRICIHDLKVEQLD